ncbi:MAG: hypothetical protein EPO08_05815 [Rhodospirillaceae bacterium]|nr:MAG: hypothetical protein EPO08_05815 [Rhodospirillaceae bacterium]
MARAKSLSDPKVTPIRRDNTAIGFVLSIAFHAAVIGAFWISWPYLHHDTPIEPPLIVDLVPIDEMTTAPPKAAPKPDEPAPQPEPQPQPEPPKPDNTPPPPDQTPPPPPPEPLPPPKPTPTPAPPVTPPPPPKPQPPKPKKKDDMASLEKLLKDIQKQQPKPQAAGPKAPTPDTSTNNQAPSVSDRATMTELDAIRHHFEGCWRIDPGMEGIENLSVEIRVYIGLDGSVQRAEILDMTRYFADAQFRTFANNARIAVLGCAGVPISPEHYEELKEMVLNFSPQGRIN